MVNRFQRNRRASISEQFIYIIAAQAHKQAAVVIELLVAYDKLSRTAPEYGLRQGNYNTWYYLDQLETAAQHISNDINVSFNPHETGTSHSLAANVLQPSDVNIDFQ